MKIVFLDIDGVLNSGEWYKERQTVELTPPDTIGLDTFREFSPKLVKRLNRLISETGAKIVVSSTWRISLEVEILQRILTAVGVEGEVLSKTEHLGGVKGYTIPRGCEIAKWLKERKFQRINWSKEEQEKHEEKSEVKNYVILDDDSDMLYNQREHFVQTTFSLGLTEENVDQAVKILNQRLTNIYYKI